MRQSSAPPLAAPAVRQRTIIVSAVVVAHAAVVAMMLSAEVRVDQPPQPHVIRLQIAPFAGPQARQSSPPPMRPSLADAQQSRPQMKPAQSQPVQSQMQATPSTTPATPSEPVGRAAAPSITNNTAVYEDRQPTIDASFLGNQPPVYPVIARRRGEQGTVILRVLITPDGRASDVELVRGSGSAHLDRSAIETIRQWRFVPAIKGGRPAAAWYEWRWEFRLEG
ncbi:MAG: energy transducer TonB [Betaproteobacteria bacterium]|nr:energy transducer TonB [Betaproteobacteria bacterium]